MSRDLLQKTLLAAAAVAIGWLAVKYLLPISLPFLLGLGLALAAEPGVATLSQKLHFPRKAATGLAVTLVFVLTATVVILAGGVLMRQLARLESVMPQMEQALTQATQTARQQLYTLSSRLPGNLQDALRSLADRAGGNLLTEQMLQKVPQMATGLLGSVSAGIFGTVTGIISGYMISARLPRWKEKLPNAWQQRLLPGLQSVKKAMGGWLLAQLKLAMIAFVLLLAGFWLLKIPNALWLAGIITIVDAFPALGVGMILIPWGVISFLTGNHVLGAGLIGLYVAIWLIRSVLEPRLVGKGLGLDPLVTLICFYAGWRLFGIAGMLLAPIFALAVCQVYRQFRRPAENNNLL